MGWSVMKELPQISNSRASESSELSQKSAVQTAVASDRQSELDEKVVTKSDRDHLGDESPVLELPIRTATLLIFAALLWTRLPSPEGIFSGQCDFLVKGFSRDFEELWFLSRTSLESFPLRPPARLIRTQPNYQ